MDRQTHLMINDAGYNETSSWSSLAKSLVGAAGKLYDQRGNIVEGVGQWYGGQVEKQASDAMALQYGGMATSYGLQEGWAGINALIPGVQGKVIELQAVADRGVAMDRWIGRISSAKAGFASAGVAVDVGTPVMMTGTFLKSLSEELSMIDLNASIRRFNEVTIPLAHAEVMKTEAQYGKRQAKTQQRVATDTGRTQEKLGWANAISTGFKVLGELL